MDKEEGTIFGEFEDKLNPFYIGISYLAVGTIWIIFSSFLIMSLVNDIRLLVFFQIVSGELFIGCSTILFFTWIKNWENSLKRSQKKIKTANQQLQVLYRLFRHNIRNNLNVVLISLEFAQRELSNSKLTKQISKAKNKIEEIVDLSQDVSDLEKIVREGPKEKKVNIPELVEKIIKNQKDNYPKVNFNIKKPEGAYIEKDGFIEIALLHIIENGIIHNNENPENKKIDIKIQDKKNSVYIEIGDNGPGIPKEEKEPIEQGQETQLNHTSRIGLWSIYWIIKSIDGEIEFDENEPTGTIVNIKLPKDPGNLKNF